MSEFRLNGFLPNSTYALISSLGLLDNHFCQFVTELRPLNDVRILFSINILRMNEWILTKFYLCLDIDDI